MWLIMMNENYDTPKLRMTAFRPAKDRVLPCKRSSFTSRKTAFCRAFHNRLAVKTLRAALRPAALHGVSNRRRRTQFYAVPGAATPADKVKK